MEEEQVFDLPAEVTGPEPQPVEPVKSAKAAKLSLKQAERAALNAGFAVVSAKALSNCGTLGEYAEQIGVINLNRGKIAMAQAHMEQLLGECRLRRQVIDNQAQHTEEFVSIVNAEQKILSSYIESAGLALKVARVEHSVVKPEPPAHRSFLPGQVVQAVQLTVNNPAPVNMVATEPPEA